MAVRFDASGDKLGRTTNLINNNNNYTIMAWFYLTSDLNAVGTFFSFNRNDSANGLNEDWIGVIDDGTTLGIWCATASSYDAVTGSGLSTSTWYHVTLIRSANNVLRGYLNGTLDITNTVNVSGRTAANRQEIGAEFSSNLDRIDGRVAYIKAWTAALDDAERLSEMRAIVPLRTADLYGWWPTHYGTERVKDYGVNALDWTASGTLTDEAPPPVELGLPFEPVIFLPAAAGGSSIDLSATISSASSTTDTASAVIGRALDVNRASASTTGDAALVVENLITLGTTISSTSTVSDTAAVLILRALALAASSASSTTDTAVLAAARVIGATIASASSSSGTLHLQRALATGLSSSSSTPDTAGVNVARGLAVGLSSASTTAAAWSVVRALVAALNSSSSTGDASLTVTGQIDLTTSLNSASATTDTAVVAVARALTAAISSATTAPDNAILAAARALAAAIGSTSSTGTASLETVTLITLAAEIASGSDTAVAALILSRALETQIESGSHTAVGTFAVARALVASLNSGSETPDTVTLLTAIIQGFIRVAADGARPGLTASSAAPGLAVNASALTVSVEE